VLNIGNHRRNGLFRSICANDPRLPLIDIVGWALECLLAFLDHIGKDRALFLIPSVALVRALRRIVIGLSSLVFRGTGSLAARALRLVHDLGQVSRLGLFIEALIDLAVDAVQVRAIVRHWVAGAGSVVLRLRSRLDHRLDRDVRIRVFLSLCGILNNVVVYAVQRALTAFDDSAVAHYVATRRFDQAPVALQRLNMLDRLIQSAVDRDVGTARANRIVGSCLQVRHRLASLVLPTLPDAHGGGIQIVETIIGVEAPR